MNITYRAKWKELLVGEMEGHRFSVELTMGTLYVFFPTERTWEQNAPPWAKGKWNEARNAAQQWCAEEGAMPIGFTIDDSAWVDFTKEQLGSNQAL